MSNEEPQLLLICCEGVTEERYFSILREIFRIDVGIDIQIIAGDGRQHKTLVDLAVEKRQSLFAETDIFDSEDDIEVWAVCDRDSYASSFTKLREYSESQGINIAFSDPQFENYLLQHFGSPDSSKNKGAVVERELTTAMLSSGVTVGYTKGDLEWLREMIDKKFSVATAAIAHADTFSNHTKKPFFTVQRLAERLLQFSQSST